VHEEYPEMPVQNLEHEVNSLFALNKNVLLIKIPYGLSKESLAELKNLIETNTGETQVELILQNEDGTVKRLKLANRIDFNESFKNILSKILTL
jgi:hypothetical protein